MTNAEARFSIALRPRKPEGSLGRTAQDVHLDSHTAPELQHYRPVPLSSWSDFVKTMVGVFCVLLSLYCGSVLCIISSQKSFEFECLQSICSSGLSFECESLQHMLFVIFAVVGVVATIIINTPLTPLS